MARAESGSALDAVLRRDDGTTVVLDRAMYFDVLDRQIREAMGVRKSRLVGTSSPQSIAAALIQIRDQRLYRGTHRGFDEYCLFKFGMLPSDVEKAIARGSEPEPPVVYQIKLLPVGTPATQPQGGIYFLHATISNRIKIGATRLFARRFAVLSRQSPEPLSISGVIKTADLSLEVALHKRFSHLRVYGEWFAAESELVTFISTEASRYE